MSTSSRPICRHHWRGEVFIFWLSLVNSIIVFQRYNNIQSKRRNKGKQGICWVEIELNIDTFQVTLKRRDISPTQLPQFGDKFRDHWSSCSRSRLWTQAFHTYNYTNLKRADIFGVFVSTCSRSLGLEEETPFFVLFNILISVFSAICLQCAVNSLPRCISQSQSFLILTRKLYQHRYWVKWIWEFMKCTGS